MAIAMLLTIWAAMLAAGDTPIGRFLRTACVARPAAWLDRIGRGHVALASLLLVIGLGALWAGGGDAVRVMGLAAPDLFVWATTFEVATYLDLAVTIALTASLIRFRRVRAPLPVRYVGRPGRAVRRRRSTRVRVAANDDGDERSRRAA